MADRTKQWIAAAMKRLMTAKSLDRIRVTEICREAEIQRPTFYYHFRDKYELVAWIFFQDADATDVLSAVSAAVSMNRMRQEGPGSRRGGQMRTKPRPAGRKLPRKVLPTPRNRKRIRHRPVSRNVPAPRYRKQTLQRPVRRKERLRFRSAVRPKSGTLHNR